VGGEEMNTVMCINYCAEKCVGVVGTTNSQLECFGLDEELNFKNYKSPSIANPGINQLNFRSDNKVR
jgi:hypothetical protein